MKAEVNSQKAEVATDCAKHRNVKAEVNSEKAEVDTECAKHRNVKAEINSEKAEVDTECAKHRNVKAEVNSQKAEVRRRSPPQASPDTIESGSRKFILSINCVTSAIAAKSVNANIYVYISN
ncbi:hypothetical protein NSTC731_04751 [Nostoc sp. DSM 114167]